MTTEALPSLPSVRPRRRTLIVAVLAALAGAAIAVGIMLSSSGSPEARPGAVEIDGGDFTIAYPAGWTALSRAELLKTEGAPAALMRRLDGHGTVIVRRHGAAPKDQSLAALTKDLTKRLDKQFADFRFVSSRVVRIRGGNAFLYTFLRTRTGVAQSIAITRVGETSFTLDAVATAGDTRAAREVAAIVRSFGR